MRTGIFRLPGGWRERAEKVAGDRRARRTVRALERHGGLVGVGALALAVGTGAVLVPGVRAADEHLDDQAVYVANSSASLIGMVNPQITQLAAAAPVSGQSGFTIWQDAQQVLVQGATSNQLQQYNPATNTMGAPMNLPAGAAVAVQAGRVSITNPSTGKVWFRPVTEIRDDLDQARPALDVGEYGTATVTSAGTLVGVDVVTSELVRAGAFEGEQLTAPVDLGLTKSSRNVQISAVGDRAVVYDGDSRAIWLEDGSATDLAGSGRVQLAQPVTDVLGEDDWHALFANETGLSVLEGSRVRNLVDLPALRGTPVRPVVRGECAYSALQRSTGDSIGSLVKYCRGADPVVLDIPLPDSPAEPRLRLAVNRGTVVLNETVSGQSWIVDDELRAVPQAWSQLTPPSQTSTNQTSTGSSSVQRSTKQHPPVAVADQLGARAGRATVLDVVANDHDPDGDVITVSEAPTRLRDGIVVERIRGGAALQVTVPSGTTGTVSFPYTISDGYPRSTATATVTLRLADAAASRADQPPVQTRTDRTLTVAQRGQANLRALLDWRDPEGDDIVLVDATTTDPDDEVAFTADGNITYRAIGAGTAARRLDLVVSDGVRTTKGSVKVVVTPKAFAPVANADHYQTRVGTKLLLTPTDNDEGEGLKLGAPGAPTRAGASTPEVGSWALERKQADNALEFTANVPGTWYLTYPVTSSTGGPSEGIIRIDVTARSQANTAPVAARDVGLMTSTNTVLVDPLANDTDADGDVLVVQSVQAVDANAPVRLELQQRQYVHVEAIRRITKPVQLRYWVSDGENSVAGTIMVVPAEPSSGRAQPVAAADELRVRAGTTGSVDVLRNDHSPLGLDLHLVRLEGAAGDSVWIDGDRIRVATAPSTDGTSFPVTYVVADSDGKQASGVLNVQVNSSDGKNDAPTPQVVEARVLSGTSTRVRIPLDGIDPDGDPVRLVGLGSGPRLGRITQLGDGYLTYEAFPGSRLTDTFKYQVMDAKGAVGVGEVRVGIAERRTESTAPTANLDTLAVRPGRAVQWPVLANDHDIDGDPITLGDADTLELPFPATVTNRTDLSFTVPSKTGLYTGTYLVRDQLGLNSRGGLSLTVSATAPLHAPVARDDIVAPSQITGKEWIQVPVTRNDFDLDGRARDLTISVPADEAAQGVEVQSDGSLRVPVQETTRQFRYRATDTDQLWAEAVVTVPGRENQLPALRAALEPQVVTAGQTTTFDLNQLAVGTSGRKLVIRGDKDIVATTGEANHDGAKVYFTPALTSQGPAAVVVNVTEDVPVAEGPRQAWLTIPVTVKRAPSSRSDGKQGPTEANLPPQGAVPTITVTPGEVEMAIGLASHFTDLELQDFHFEGWSAARGGDAALEFRFNDTQDTILVKAGIKTTPGAKRTITGSVVDAGGSRAPVTIQLVAGTSRRPLPVAGTDTVDEAVGGRASTVSVLANDRSFVKPDTLTLVGTPVVTQGRATVAVKGDQVVVTPAEGFHGLAVVTYTIQDATGDPDRQVDGQVRLIVLGKPDPPGTPVASEVGDQKATLTWSEPSDNGLPITRYLVTATSATAGTRQQECTSSRCTITGLTNDAAYTMTVQAYNELGHGAASRPSAPISPDVRPDAPNRPVATSADGAVELSWEPPANRGSAIQHYEVQVGAPLNKTVKLASVTNYRWAGLTNGQEYTFRVRATNKVAEPGEWSPASASVIPVGKPSAPTAVTATDTGAKDGGVVRIAWRQPADTGGAAITRYTVQAIEGGRTTTINTVDGDVTATTWSSAVAGRSYVFRVIAENSAGAGPAGSSETYRPWGRPDAPSGFTITGGRNQVTLTGLGSTDDRTPVTGYEFWVETGGDQSRHVEFAPGEALPTIGDLQAGKEYVGRLVAVSSANGVTRISQVGSTKARATVHGQLGAVELVAGAARDGAPGSRSYRVRALSAQSLDAAGVTELRYEVSSGDGNWTTVKPDTDIAVQAPTSVVARAVDTGHDLAGLETTLGLDTTMSVDQDPGSKKVQVWLQSWPGTTVRCTLATADAQVAAIDRDLNGGSAGATFEWAPGMPDPANPPNDIPLTVQCQTQGQDGVTQTTSYTWKQAP
ncbi:MAG TPA: fibronectin type III domain-containing protein [Candidatus Luteococcus avicola]|nr:fibronectin type III domain-containing protein [Candidatus Luteococcus avicola]